MTYIVVIFNPTLPKIREVISSNFNILLVLSLQRDPPPPHRRQSVIHQKLPRTRKSRLCVMYFKVYSGAANRHSFQNY